MKLVVNVLNKECSLHKTVNVLSFYDIADDYFSNAVECSFNLLIQENSVRQ